MPFRLFCLSLITGLIANSNPVLSHEFWIAPEKYQVTAKAPVLARLRNGQNFHGAEQPYLDHRIARFEVLQGDGAMPYDGRMGDMPAFVAPSLAEGLAVIVHQTQPQQLVYETWEEFQSFVDDKGFGDVLTQHRALELPETGFAEQYTRYAKALVAVGAGSGQDQAAGLETEIVAQANPYTDDLTRGLPVQLLYQGNPRPRAQLTIFAMAPDGNVTRATLLSDDQGMANIPPLPGFRYMLDAVVLRPAPEGADYAWESHWATLTFAVPSR